MERIKQLRRWVCWNATPVKGRMTKVPCAANGGATGTDEKYAHTWVTYEEAVEAMKRNGYTGVGFVIPEGMFFIDKDHVDPNDPVVQELLRRFPSYAECSYSGNGVHFFGMCDLSRIPVLNGKLDKRYYTKNPHNGLEVYIGSLTNRFAAFTDEPIQDLPLTDCTDALLELLEKDMRREKEPQPVQEEIIDEAVDEDDPRIGEIIEALRWDRNALKFVRLFDEGDITGYASQSEADAALCAIIAFRAGPNPALIDAIFRQSALYRDDKWERADYRASTIQCGIAARRGVYHHSTQVKPFFVMQNPKSGAESISSTRLAQFVREKLRYSGIADGSAMTRAPYVSLDVTDDGAISRELNRLRPDAVVHCAGWTNVDEAEDPEKGRIVADVNVLGTENIARECSVLGCKMLYISTDYVFGGTGEEPWNPDSSAFAPLNVYGKTKLGGELAVRRLIDRYFIVRISWAFGANGGNFVKTMLSLGKKYDSVRVVCDQIGTPTYTLDLARLLVDMIETEKYGIYHATNEGGYISWADFAREIFRQAGMDTRVIPVTTADYGLSKAARPFNSRLDKAKLVESGFAPLPDWRDALGRYLKEVSYCSGIPQV